MDRSEYIKARELSSIEILYWYYTQHFDKSRHKPFLDYPQFIEFMQMWPQLQQAFNVSVAYYDAKFNVLKCPLRDKTLFI